MPVRKDLTGMRFGKLTVLYEDNDRTTHGCTRWICRCECGTIKSIDRGSLTSGKTRSCGCLHNELLGASRRKHGSSGSRLYRIWKSIKERCYRKKCRIYKYYGERGVCICDEWKDDFKSFEKWARSNGYNDELSIDRIDHDGNYSPDNCRWVDAKAQNNNKRTNHILTLDGVSHTMSEWADITGISYSAIRNRINNYGWDVRRALSTPVKK